MFNSQVLNKSVVIITIIIFFLIFKLLELVKYY